MIKNIYLNSIHVTYDATNLFKDMLCGIIKLSVDRKKDIRFHSTFPVIKYNKIVKNSYCIGVGYNTENNPDGFDLDKIIYLDRDLLEDIKSVNHERVCDRWLRLYQLPFVDEKITSPMLDDIESACKKKKQIIDSTKINMDPVGVTTNKNLVLILLNRRYNSFGNFGIDPYIWCNKVVKTVREQTNLPILVKHHPERLDEDQYNFFKNIKFGNDVYHYATEERTNMPDGIKEDFENRNIHSTISFNTSAGLRYYLTHDVPMIIDGEKSLLKQFSCGNINDIKNAQMLDKNKFLTWYCSTHWTSEQLLEAEPILKLLHD